MRISVVTTFNLAGYELYGKKMLEGFSRHWPSSVTLYAFLEGFDISEPVSSNIQTLDLHDHCADLVAFKHRWSNVPQARGDITEHPVLKHRADRAKTYKWDAVRFSNKVYAVHKCSEFANSDFLLWMDGDMICHSVITESDLASLLPSWADIGFLGRQHSYTECGLYALNLKSHATRRFLSVFKQQYDSAETGIFSLPEWHDSYVFDHVRKLVPLREHDWSKNSGTESAHPLINSAWGAYLDHLKGGRKHQGQSDRSDLEVVRTEDYWNTP